MICATELLLIPFKKWILRVIEWYNQFSLPDAPFFKTIIFVKNYFVDSLNVEFKLKIR